MFVGMVHSGECLVLRGMNLSKNCNGSGEMSLPYIYYLAGWNFVISVNHKNNRSLSILYNTMHLHVEFVCNGQLFGRMFSSFLMYSAAHVRPIYQFLLSYDYRLLSYEY